MSDQYPTDRQHAEHAEIRDVVNPAVRDAVRAQRPPWWKEPPAWLALFAAALAVVAVVLLVGKKNDTITAKDKSIARQGGQISALQNQVRALGGTPVAGPKGPAGLAGRGIAGARVISGELVLTYTDSTTADVGTVVGPRGAKGPKGSAGVSGSPGRAGRPGQPGTSGAPGANGQDGKNGTDGRGVTSTAVTDDGHLIVAYSDGTSIDAGTVVGPKGAAGRSVRSVDVSADGHLIVTYDDGSISDAGALPTGPVCPSGYSIQTKAAPPPYLGETWAVCVQN